jgi:hypothetical protein
LTPVFEALDRAQSRVNRPVRPSKHQWAFAPQGEAAHRQGMERLQFTPPNALQPGLGRPVGSEATLSISAEI